MGSPAFVPELNCIVHELASQTEVVSPVELNCNPRLWTIVVQGTIHGKEAISAMEQWINLNPGDHTGVNGACRQRLLFVMENLDPRPQDLDKFMAECCTNRNLAGKKVN